MALDKNIVELQLAKFGKFNKWLSRPECDCLHEVMETGEEIKALTSGYFESRNCLIAITNCRLLIVSGKRHSGFRQESLPLSTIVAMSFSSGFRYGQFEFKTIAGEKKIDMLEKKDVALLAPLLTELLASFR